MVRLVPIYCQHSQDLLTLSIIPVPLILAKKITCFATFPPPPQSSLWVTYRHIAGKALGYRPTPQMLRVCKTSDFFANSGTGMMDNVSV